MTSFTRTSFGFSGKVKDISEFLAGLTLNRQMAQLPLRVAYDDPCHLLHGQGISHEPRQLLEQIPGVALVPFKEADWCCGSAGTYNLTQPEMSRRLLDRKLQHLAAVDPDVIATGNPGCLLQLAWGVKRAGLRAQCCTRLSCSIVLTGLGRPPEARRAARPVPGWRDTLLRQTASGSYVYARWA